jgi:hypothetical protein
MPRGLRFSLNDITTFFNKIVINLLVSFSFRNFALRKDKLFSCSSDNESPEYEPEYNFFLGEPNIIFDTDIGSSTDDLFALRLMYKFSDMGLCHILGGVVCRMGDEYIRLADIMNTHYGYPDLPMGVERDGVEDPNVYIPYSGISDLKNEDGSVMFPTSISNYASLPDGWKLYRKLLADQPDGSVRICAIGFMSALAQLLESGPDEYSELTGVELVRRKVQGLFVMGGKFGEDSSRPGYNFGHKSALGFSKRVLDLWPKTTNIYFSPSLIGDDVDYAPSTVIEDINWTDVNPIKQVYMNYNCNTGQRMWDALTTLQTLLGSDLFELSERGTIHITEDGLMPFVPDPEGNCYYQKYSASRTPYYLMLIRDATTTPPTELNSKKL